MSLGYSRPDDLPDTLSTIMQDIIDDKPVEVSRSILHHDEGVDLLPSNIELSGLEVRLINAISRESILKTCINEVKKNYDTINQGIQSLIILFANLCFMQRCKINCVKCGTENLYVYFFFHRK